jgi:Tol biopolymer transport system component
LEILLSIPEDANLTGHLILGAGRADAYILDMATATQLEIPLHYNNTSGGFSVSPDGNWMSYFGVAEEPTEDYIVFQSVDGKEVNSFPWGDFSGTTPLYWLNNEWIVMWKPNQGSDMDSLVFLNIFTGENKELLPDYPNIFDDDYNSPWPTNTVYDPSLTRVIYIDYDGRLVYWDRQTSQPIIEIPNHVRARDRPQWSPDGKQFVYLEAIKKQGFYVKGELVLVSWEGEITPLTHFGDYYKESKIFRYIWSPDGQYIAFWLNYRLSVLNVVNQKVTDYCIITSSKDLPYPPLWSPDSRHLAIAVIDDNKDTRTILVDIMNGYAAQITENFLPGGWLVSPSE